MNKTETIKIGNNVTDLQLVKIIKDYEEEGFSVRVNSKNQDKGYIELIIKK